MVGVLARSDPNLKRFGASVHRYALFPPILGSELAAIERQLGASLPDDYREHVLEIAAGGVGPYYGLLPVQRAAAFVVDAPPKLASWRRALPIAHVGCGYFAVIALDGVNAGEIWLDARQADFVEPMWPTFAGFIVDWLDRLEHNRWLDGYVPLGRCSLQNALTAYLRMIEDQEGIPEGTIAGEALRSALSALGPGSIVIAAEAGRLFQDRDNVDPCIRCARILENLSADGLAAGVVAPGMLPLPAR